MEMMDYLAQVAPMVHLEVLVKPELPAQEELLAHLVQVV
jgi:hypothetical protein